MNFVFRLKMANSTRATDRKFKFGQKTFTEKHIKDENQKDDSTEKSFIS